MSALRTLLSACLLLAAGGCVLPVPVRLQMTPHVAGVVQNQSTKAPVPQARLHWEHPSGEDFFKQVVWTSVDGQFDFPAIYRWALMGADGYEGWLVVDAPGYQSTNSIHVTDCPSWRASRVVRNIVIDLRPQVESAEPSGPANGSQPIRSETNGTSGTAGSRR